MISYTEETSGGADKEGFGYFSSIIPTITSESAIHLSSNFITGTFPSGFTSKNLKQTITIPKTHFITTNIIIKKKIMELILELAVFTTGACHWC